MKHLANFAELGVLCGERLLIAKIAKDAKNREHDHEVQ